MKLYRIYDIILFKPIKLNNNHKDTIDEYIFIKQLSTPLFIRVLKIRLIQSLKFILYNSHKFLIYGILSYIIIYNYNYLTNNTKIEIIENTKYIFDPELKTYSQLIHDVGKSESNNNWISRRAGSQYVGWFQFGNIAFKECSKHGLDIHKFGLDNFLNSPTAQQLWFEVLLRSNKQYLSDIILKWNYRQIDGIDGTITESGILMGAHLVGHAACRQFFESNGTIIPKDGNGVPITKYIERFSGYTLPTI